MISLCAGYLKSAMSGLIRVGFRASGVAFLASRITLEEPKLLKSQRWGLGAAALPP